MLKLYLNENVPEAISKGLILRGYDALTTRKAGNSGISDLNQLKFATKENRSLVSFNVKDFSKIHLEYMEKDLKHKGIILSKQLPVGVIMKGLIKIMLLKTQEEVENNIVWVSNFL